MARYIDAERFAERIKLSPAFKNMAFEGDLLQRVVLDLLGNAPTADVVEVKHGEWITDENGVVICSECGEEHEWQDFRPPYCDMCGSKNRDGRSDI